MKLYDRIYKMNVNFAIWRYTERLRITYVASGWFVIWDHQQSPPSRYDCQAKTHDKACEAVMLKLGELAVD